jgi:predicted transcriptional regulator of viral defense system
LARHPNKARAPRLDYQPLRIVRFPERALAEGIEEHRVDGVPVRITNLARTVVDCFLYRSKLGLDLALQALRESWKARRVTIDALWRYARLCRPPMSCAPAWRA